MSREARRVPADWEHPKDYRGNVVPLFEGPYEPVMEEWIDDGLRWVNGEHDHNQTPSTWRAWCEREGDAPRAEDYMPDWSEAEKTHLMMYESVSEGTPISPAFETAEELASFLADVGASAFGSMTATYDEWLATVRAGWAPSAILSGGRMQSGVAASKETPNEFG